MMPQTRKGIKQELSFLTLRLFCESDPGFQSKIGARFRHERISMLGMVNAKNNYREFSCILVSYVRLHENLGQDDGID